MTARSLSTQSEIARQGCAHGFLQPRVLAEKPGVRCRATPWLRRRTASDQRIRASGMSLVAAGADHVEPPGTRPGFRAVALVRFAYVPRRTTASTRGSREKSRRRGVVLCVLLTRSPPAA